VSAAIPPLVLIFGPVDPSGSNGLPADAITCAKLGCHALSAITALTVQDTADIEDIQPVSPEMLDDEARCLLEDMPVQSIKVGGLFTTETVSAAAQIAADYSQVPLVLHLNQHALLPEDAADQDDAEDLIAATFELLLPQADVVVVEHSRLAQWVAEGHIEIDDLPSPAHALIAAGAQWVLLLGHDVRPGSRVNTLLGPEGQTASWPYVAPPERGTDAGGLLAACLAAMLAQGKPMEQAVELALSHADTALAASFLPGMGRRIANRFVS
jgi:hydroxymethylpyrimidine/phosphomethylpyrimidine kinase